MTTQLELAGARSVATAPRACRRDTSPAWSSSIGEMSKWSRFLPDFGSGTRTKTRPGAAGRNQEPRGTPHHCPHRVRSRPGPRARPGPGNRWLPPRTERGWPGRRSRWRTLRGVRSCTTSGHHNSKKATDFSEQSDRRSHEQRRAHKPRHAHRLSDYCVHPAAATTIADEGSTSQRSRHRPTGWNRAQPPPHRPPHDPLG